MNERCSRKQWINHGYYQCYRKAVVCRNGRWYCLDFLPFAMLYRAPSGNAWAYEWRQLQKTWARPAAFKAKMRGATQ